MFPKEFQTFLDALNRGEESAFQAFLIGLEQREPRAGACLVEAFNETLRPIIHRYLEYLGLRKELDSVDVVQSIIREALIKIPQGANTFASFQQFKAYFLTAARRRLISRKRRPSPTSLEENDLQASEPSQSQLIDEKIFLDEIQQHLPADLQEVFRLRREGLSWAEVAERLEYNPDRIHTLEARFNRELRRVRLKLHLLEE